MQSYCKISTIICLLLLGLVFSSNAATSDWSGDELLAEWSGDKPLEESSGDAPLEESSGDAPLEEWSGDAPLEESSGDEPLEEWSADEPADPGDEAPASGETSAPTSGGEIQADLDSNYLKWLKKNIKDYVFHMSEDGVDYAVIVIVRSGYVVSAMDAAENDIDTSEVPTLNDFFDLIQGYIDIEGSVVNVEYSAWGFPESIHIESEDSDYSVEISGFQSLENKRNLRGAGRRLL